MDNKLAELLDYERQYGTAPAVIFAGLSRVEKAAYRAIQQGKPVYFSVEAFKQDFKQRGYVRITTNGKFGVWHIFSGTGWTNAAFAKIFAGYVLEKRNVIRLDVILEEDSAPDFPIYSVDASAARFVKV
jgi:YHS domain-containing protein